MQHGGAFPGLLPWPQVDFTKFGPIERKDLSRIKKISGANLHRNWVLIPHVTNHDEADITDLAAFRVQLNKENEKAKDELLAALETAPGFRQAQKLLLELETGTTSDPAKK